MKICRDCDAEKPASEFYRHSMMADGRLNSCKMCRRAYERQHRFDYPEIKSEYERKRGSTPERKAHLRANSERWEKRHPDRKKAQTAANNAVRDGRLERKFNCEECGSPEHLHKHHHNYSRPLDVTWLCARCHARL